MKKVLTIAMLLAISMAGFAQRQKVTVGKEGEMIVNGDTVAYIEREGCKYFSSDCMIYIVNENNEILIYITLKSFVDKDYISLKSPNGRTKYYLSFSFPGYDETAEMEVSYEMIKEKAIAKQIVLWNLIKDKKLNPEGVNGFITTIGHSYSDKERRQSNIPIIQIVQPPQYEHINK